MGSKTKIEWCDATWSPWMGCAKVSEGCAHCYAADRDHRFHGGKHWGNNGRELQSDAYWDKLRRWNNNPLTLTGGENRRPLIFPSQIDPFDEHVPVHWLVMFLDKVRTCENLVFLLLTKRPQWFWDRLEAAKIACASWEDQRLFDWLYEWTAEDKPPANVWLGVSAENQPRADERIPALLEIPAVLRFVSAEPLLGEVDLTAIAYDGAGWINALGGWSVIDGKNEPVEHGRIDWVIAGGESGPHARPMHPDWARYLLDQCVPFGVPFMFKQWGNWIPDSQRDFRIAIGDRYTWGVLSRDGGFRRVFERGERVGDPAQGPGEQGVLSLSSKARAGNYLDGCQHLEFPTLRDQPLTALPSTANL